MARPGQQGNDPAHARRAAVEILRALRAAGHTAYLAGGCVRDELLGLTPTDYDIATDATPDRIRALFQRTAEVGAAFGVVLVAHGQGPDRVVVEVATFRSDGPYSDRRRPDQVTFSDPQSDARRRDFTVNALFLDPLDHGGDGQAGPAPPETHGRVIDHVGGRADLDARILRAVGDPEQRLAEDHLRALRAVRLAARLGLTIEPATAAAIRAHARDLAGVSRERIGDEVRRMLEHPTRARAVELLDSLGLTGPVLREPERPATAPPRVLAAIGPDSSIALALGAWAVDRGVQGRAEAEALAHRWREALCLSNQETDSLAGILRALALLTGEWDRLGIAAQKRAAGGLDGTLRFEESVRLLEALRGPEAANRIRQMVAALAGSPGGLAPEPFLTGDDLVAAGRKPGPAFKRILHEVYDAQLEGRIGSKAQALELAARLGV